MSNENLADENKKFLFNVHNFDVPDEDDLDEDIYVPPTFSEDELAAAKAKAFDEGKQAGIAESTASRDQHIADILNKIANSYPDILAQENARAKLHEVEAVRLTLAIFDKLYPLFRAHFSAEELKSQIHQVLGTQSEQSSITIAVHPDLAEPVEKKLADAAPNAEKSAHFTVLADNNLDVQSFTIGWKDGGALREGEKLAQEIKSRIEEALAPFPAKSHDSKDEPQPEDSPEDAEAVKNEPDESASPTDGAIDNE